MKNSSTAQRQLDAWHALFGAPIHDPQVGGAPLLQAKSMGGKWCDGAFAETVSTSTSKETRKVQS